MTVSKSNFLALCLFGVCSFGPCGKPAALSTCNRVATHCHFSSGQLSGAFRCCLHLPGTGSLTDILRNSRQFDIFDVRQMFCLRTVLMLRTNRVHTKCDCMLYCTWACVWVWAGRSSLKPSFCCSSSLDLRGFALRLWYYFHCYVREYDKLVT